MTLRLQYASPAYNLTGHNLPITQVLDSIDALVVIIHLIQRVPIFSQDGGWGGFFDCRPTSRGKSHSHGTCLQSFLALSTLQALKTFKLFLHGCRSLILPSRTLKESVWPSVAITAPRPISTSLTRARARITLQACQKVCYTVKDTPTTFVEMLNCRQE